MVGKKVATGVIHKVPADLRRALTSSVEVLSAWNDLTPLARNEWICWTISVKKPETRKEHIERVRADLTKGKRRPCCWYGCVHRTDKAISPSVQAVVLNRKEKRRTRKRM